MSLFIVIHKERVIALKKNELKNTNPLFKIFIVFCVVVASSWSIFTVAGTVKESNLKDRLVEKQTMLTKEVNQLFDEEVLEELTIEETQEKLTLLASQMNKIQNEMKNLTDKNQETLRQESDKIVANIQMMEDLVKIRQLHDSLFTVAVFDESGLNKEAQVKEDVTLAKIEEVQKAIEQNPQAEKLAKETKMVMDFAKKQVETKAAVDSWLAKNKNKYTEKNYEAFEKLVKAVTPKAAQEAYKKTLADFKKAVDKQIKKEKEEAKKKAEAEAKEQQQVAASSGNNQSATGSNAPSSQAPSAGNQSSANGATTNQQKPANQAVQNQAPAAPPVQPAPAPRTDGFNFKGQHFDLSSFSGVGAVPQWTPYIYQWSDDPSHYLIEKASNAGSAIWSVGIGDQVVINGQTYTVFNMMSNVPNDDNAYGVLKSQGATVTWQTCDSANPNSTLTLWFAA